MLLILGLLAYFSLVGLAARRFGSHIKWLLLAGIVALVVIDYATRALP